MLVGVMTTPGALISTPLVAALRESERAWLVVCAVQIESVSELHQVAVAGHMGRFWVWGFGWNVMDLL